MYEPYSSRVFVRALSRVFELYDFFRLGRLTTNLLNSLAGGKGASPLLRFVIASRDPCPISVLPPSMCL